MKPSPGQKGRKVARTPKLWSWWLRYTQLDGISTGSGKIKPLEEKQILRYDQRAQINVFYGF